MFGFRFRQWLAPVICTAGIAASAHGGGSGLNTLVLVNQDSSNSVALGNYYCELRSVPPENLLRIHWTGGNISWTGGNISWTSGELETNLLSPLRTALAARQLSNQIQFVVLSMDIPFQTISGSSVNGTTSAIFYGAKDTSGPEAKLTENGYCFSEAPFADARPTSTSGTSLLATMITGDSLAAARHLVDQGVASDATFPSRPVILAKCSDTLRNIRYKAFDNAVFNTRIRGNATLIRTNSNQPSASTNLLGYETGLAGFSVPANNFVPGAIADSLTSFGGIIFGPNGQTSLLEFIRAGASGSYGTVSEPSPDPQKFPDPQVYFFQSRGFTLAEAYYQSIAVPYQGLIVGEPLAAPFAKPCEGKWLTASNSILNGTNILTLQFNSTADHPIQQADLFIDGKLFQTIKSLSPVPGNGLSMSLNGWATNYIVGSNDTLASITTNLTALINSPAASNISQIVAKTFGDRIELRYVGTNAFASPAPPTSPQLKGNTAPSTPSPATPFSVSSSPGAANVLGTFFISSRNYLMPSTANGLRCFTVSGPVQIGSWLQLTTTKTNGSTVTLSVTNQLLNATPYTLAGALLTNINAHPMLMARDGISAEDLISGWSNEGIFNLVSRSPGYDAANVQVHLTGSPIFAISPGTQTALNQNLSDLQPRSHLYVMTGTTNLPLAFQLDTTALPDGYHELTAVAYEGSHVRTQTHIVLPIQIRNTALNATLSSSDLTNTVPVSGTYHIAVSANANNIASVTLFSTGGKLGTVTNQSTASFTISASELGEGLHPFYALITILSGSQFRTETLRVRFSR